MEPWGALRGCSSSERLWLSPSSSSSESGTTPFSFQDAISIQYHRGMLHAQDLDQRRGFRWIIDRSINFESFAKLGNAFAGSTGISLERRRQSASNPFIIKAA